MEAKSSRKPSAGSVEAECRRGPCPCGFAASFPSANCETNSFQLGFSNSLTETTAEKLGQPAVAGKTHHADKAEAEQRNGHAAVGNRGGGRRRRTSKIERLTDLAG